MTTGPKPVPIEERFWRYVTPADGCWEWQGYRCANGYGRISSKLAHRVSWLAHSGEWPPAGMVVRHLCHNPSCVNPAHLALGTQAENLADSVAAGRMGAWRRELTHCKRGHEFTDENTYRHPRSGHRQCRICYRAYDARRRASRKGMDHGQPS